MTDSETVLGALLVSIISGIIGKLYGDHKKVGEPVCTERRDSCRRFLVDKIENLTSVISELSKKVDKLLGI